MHCRADRPGKVPNVDNGPVAQQVAERHLSAGPGHDDQVIAGKELGAADHNQDQGPGRTPARQAGGQRHMAES